MNPIVVVGAGLAGLTAARTLRRAGKAVLVLERGGEIGGRVRSRQVEGFTLDRGFQVLLTAYPAVGRNLNIDRLDLIPLPSAAVVCRGTNRETLGNPLRDPGGVGTTLGGRALGWGDKLRVAGLAARLRSNRSWTLLQGPDESTLSFLGRLGFSRGAISTVFAPFFGGVFLKRDLSTSARLFRYLFRMLMDGAVAVPRLGMGQIAKQLAEGLDIVTDSRVERCEAGAGSVAVHTRTGIIEAASVIVATDPPEIRRLTGVSIPCDPVSSTYLYYGTEQRLDHEPRLLLNADDGRVNNALWNSNTNPMLAPAGRHLLTVTVLGDTDPDDHDLDREVRKELTSWYGAAGVETLQLLAVDRIPFAQFAQPPGFAATLAAQQTGHPNVILASEATSMSSIQGAMESGERAAAILLNDPQGMGRPRGG